jgi:hypothetical protein
MISMWAGKPFSELNDTELEEATAFFQAAHDRLIDFAPTPVWVFLVDQISLLTVLKVQRLKPAA